MSDLHAPQPLCRHSVEKSVLDLVARSVVNQTSFEECAGLLNEFQHLDHYGCLVRISRTPACGKWAEKGES